MMSLGKLKCTYYQPHVSVFRGESEPAKSKMELFVKVVNGL